jgi:hypothetical protein
MNTNEERKEIYLGSIATADIERLPMVTADLSAIAEDDLDGDADVYKRAAIVFAIRLLSRISIRLSEGGAQARLAGGAATLPAAVAASVTAEDKAARVKHVRGADSICHETHAGASGECGYVFKRAARGSSMSAGNGEGGVT